MHITPMLLGAKSVNSSSFSYSIFTTPELLLLFALPIKYNIACNWKVFIVLWTSWAASGSTYKMSTHAIACFFEVVVHCQNRLIDGLFLENGKRKSATRKSLADDFKRIILW